MKKSANLFLSAFLLMGFLTIGNELLAQGPPGGGGSPGNSGCIPTPCVPIDGGLSILLIAGAAYGSKKVYDHNK